MKFSIKQSYICLAILLLILVTGVNGARASVTIIKDCDFENGETVFTADSRISLSNVIATNGDHLLQFTNAHNSNNGYSFAHYDFSQDITSDVVEVKISFDFYIANQNASYYRFFTIGQSNQRIVTDNSYPTSGAIMGFGLSRQSSTNYFSVNGAQTTTAASATNVLGAWAHADIVVDLTNKKVSYQIKSYDKSTTYYSAVNIDYWDTNASTCNQIDFFDKENNATSWLDNIVITKRINDGLYSYTVRSDAGKLIANGTCAPNTTVTVPFPEFELRGYTLYQTANNGNKGYYRNDYTINNADQQEIIYYTQASYANVIYYSEAEDIDGATIATGSNADIRCSMGKGASVPTTTVATGLHNGAYRIWGQVRGTEGTEFSFNADDAKVWSLTTNGNLTSTLGTPFQVLSTTEIKTNAAGSDTRMLDCFYIQAVLVFKEPSSTITIGTTNYRPDLIWSGAVPTFTSSNFAVASVTTDGIITAHHNGTAVITAKQTIDGVEYYTTHTVTVTREEQATYSFTYDETNKKEDFAISGTGGLPEYCDGTTFNIGFGSTDETQAAINNLAHCEDRWGYWHVHLSNDNSGVPDMGTYYIIRPKLGYQGQISIYAYVADQNGTRNGIRMTDGEGNSIFRITDINSSWTTYNFTTELIGGRTYYLFAETGSITGALNSAYSNLQVQKFTFTQSPYVNTSEVIAIPASGSCQITNSTGMPSPTYEIVNYYGELNTTRPTIDSGTGILSNVTVGGALRIALTYSGYTAYHLLTVAYPATEYPGHFWDFNVEGEPMTTADLLRTVPVPPNTALGNSGDTWTALYKVNTGGYTRAPEWRLNRAINGDNVLVVPETAGLLFNTDGHGFYMRNDDETFRHVGIHDIGASFTIPYLKAGDIVELNWKHDAGNNGSTFSATHLKDLRNKTIPEDDTFLITESAERDKYNHVGRYSFIVAEDGDVTFTLKDAGYTDILSIRIYKGPYRSTMLNIDLKDRQDGDITPTELLLDNSERGFTYNYCNQLYSTATGPAMYVLKGYRKQTDESQTLGVDYDHKGCVTGTDASRNFDAQDQALFILHTDEDAYPVSDAEKARLYELRKHLVGLEMYNEPWQSANNSYNYGHIKARSGWGKVTIRMNNYTNDMKYVIGYTNDYTLTIGSAPHQEYPYTWDFTKISAGTATARSDNVFNCIYKKEGVVSDESDQYSTNWIKRAANGTYTLNTDNRGDDGSQYVPGAILVTTDRALSKYIVNDNETAVFASDELDGLGFNGQVTINPLPAINASARSSVNTRAMGTNSLLSYRMDDASYTVNSALAAGSGTITFGADKREANPVAACGYGYKCDGDVTTSKYALLHLSRALVVGDVVTIRAFATSTPSGSDYGLSLYESNSSGAPLATMYLTTVKNHEEVLCHTVTMGDALIGKQDIYVFRASGKSTYITEIEVLDGNFGMADGEPMHCDSEVTLTVPDLNDGVQDWIYVSSSTQPSAVTNATLVTDAAGGGPDANQSPEVEDADTHVYKYKVNGNSKVNSNITFAAGTNIYKIGVTHILKDIHSVGGTGWATEIRNHNIDHELTGYFTKNDVNAYTVTYDSYDMKTATVALTPINEDGYVPTKTGIVMRLDNIDGLTDANSGVNVPLFYPSYTRPWSTTPVDFPVNNLMYNVDVGIDNNNQNGNEQYFNLTGNGINYTKFVLTNIHWTYTVNNNSGSWSGPIENQDAAGFYRLHIWGDDRDIMPAHNAFMLVPTDNLPNALWQQYPSGARQNTIGIRCDWANGVTDINKVKDINREGYASVNMDEEPWFTMSGMKLSGPPTKAGIYIHHHRKVVIK